jgi:DNA-directed RNA polymerase specialized sigma24 family protein
VTHSSDKASRGDEPPTSTSLLRGAAHDDRGAWHRLVATYSPLVYAWSRRAGLQPSDASDLVQEVMQHCQEHRAIITISVVIRSWLAAADAQRRS